MFRRRRSPPPTEPSPVTQAAQRLAQLAEDLQRGSVALLEQSRRLDEQQLRTRPTLEGQ